MSVSLQNRARDAFAKALFHSGVSPRLLRNSAHEPIVLLYHNPDPQVFSAHLRFLGERYAFVRAPGAKPDDPVPDRPSVAFTFDDGYRGVHIDILPLLRQARAPATMFVPTAFLGKRFGYEALKLALQKTSRKQLDFNGRHISLADSAERKDAWHALVASLKLESANTREEHIDSIIGELEVPAADLRGAEVLSRDELGVMAKELEIGSHTVTHPNLARLEAAEIERELVESKAEIQTISGKPCRLFAYPIGRSDDYTELAIRALGRAGYVKAFTAVPTTSPKSDFEYPRVGIGDKDSIETLCLKLSTLWPTAYRLLA